MAEAVLSVVTQVAESLFGPIQRQIGYVCKYKSNIYKLKKQQEKLEGRRKRLQIDVEMARRQGDEIHQDVEIWLRNVDEFTKKAADVTSKFSDVAPDITSDDGDEKSMKSCFKRLVPHPNLKVRYLLSKKAIHLVNDCVTLFNIGDFQRVSYRNRLQRSDSMYSRGYEAFDSRESIFKDIMEELRGTKVNMIGVHGMAGVGKTTLVRKVAAQAKVDGLFDEVVVVEVKPNPQIKTIQDEVAEQLGMVLEEKTVDFRASVLCERLKKDKRVLMVLDNLWGELNWEQVGIPLGISERRSSQKIQEPQNGRDEDNRICKILLTSRDLQVCNAMKTGKNFLVMALSNGEAMDLFWKLLDDSTKKFEFESVAIEIVRKCDGLPLAITAIAKSLQNKSKPYWNDALNRLKRSNIEDINASVYSIIRLSYDFLKKEEAKSLFLLCGMFSVGYLLDVSDLVRYGIGFNMFKNVNTLKEGRERVNALIEDLKAASLLLDDENKFIKMHEVIHGVAQRIATEKLMFNMQNVVNLIEELEKERYKNSTVISLPYGNTRELPERLECPEVEIFLLFGKDDSLHIPDLFFMGMEKLRVLDLTKISFLSLPSSLGNLTSLQTLSLDFCMLSDVTMIGKLTKLKILSFRGSNIEVLPQEIGHLTQLKLLDLSKCSKLKVIAPNVLSSLSLLEELFVDSCFVQWDVQGQNNNASLAELKDLPYLTTLHIHVNDAETVPQDLLFENLERYNILIGDVWDSYAVSKTSRALKVKLNKENVLGCGVAMLLMETEDLYLSELNGFRNVYPELAWDGCPNLKQLHVDVDPYISYIIGEEQCGGYDAFPILESLFLHHLINLKEICYGKLRCEHFSKLKIIKVEKCDGLTHLFSLSKVEIFSQLQEIELMNCKNMKVIVGEENEENIYDTKMEFSQLQSLTLKCLPNFTGCGLATNTESGEITAVDDHADFMTLFGKKVAFPNLKSMNLSSLNIKSIWFDQLPENYSFSRILTNLVVENCSRLKFLFSLYMVQSLEQLQRLEICNCESIEMIIDTKCPVGGNMTTEIFFPKLLYLKLEGLWKLTKFGSGSLIQFPSLNDLRIENCSNLKTFFSNLVCADAPVLLDEKVALPALVSLKLSSVGCENIWLKQFFVTSSCIENLTKLSVDGCGNMKFLFLSSMLKTLEQLKLLEICDCKIMEEVIVTEEVMVTEEERMCKMLFPNLIEMKLIDLPKLKRLCSFTGNSVELPLTRLWIENCQDMETFISSSTRPKVTEVNQEEVLHGYIQPLFHEKVRLPNLDILIIRHMDNLRKIWHNRQALSLSSKLCKLSVGYCNKLLNIFPYHTLGRLGKLEEMYAYDCDALENIYETHERSSCIIEGNLFAKEEEVKAVCKFVFPRLAMLLLMRLPRLKSFYQGLHTLECPVLKKLQVYGCKTVQTFCSEYLSFQESDGKSQKGIFLEQYPLFLIEKVAFPSLEVLDLLNMPKLLHLWWESSKPCKVFPKLTTIQISQCSNLKIIVPSSVLLPNLINLEVSKCGGLMNLVSISTAKSLVQLKRIDVIDCKMMEEFIVHAGEQEKYHVVFRQLEYLRLYCLPQLTSFCSGNYIFKFPSLEEVIAKQCPNMTIFSSGVLSTPKLQRLQLREGEDEVFPEGDPSTTIQIVGFCGYESLRLSVPTQRNFGSQIPAVKFFGNLRSLVVDDYDCISGAIPTKLLRCLHNLKRLEVRNCNSLEEVFDLDDLKVDRNLGLLTNLSLVYLTDLPRLRHIWKESCDEVLSFKNLNQLELHSCSSLRYVFTLSAAQVFLQLQILKITNCALLKEVIMIQGEKDTSITTIIFPSLNSIILDSLPELRSFFTGSSVLKCPSLETITIANCLKMKTFSFSHFKDPGIHITPLFSRKDELPCLMHLKLSSISCEKIWHNQFSRTSSIRSLKTLIMDGCNSLKFLSFSSVVGCLIKLRDLEINNCKSIEAVTVAEEETASKKMLLKIEKLKLTNLPQLTRFCDFTGNSIELDSLSFLHIENCPNLETFISSSSCAEMTSRKENDIQPFFDEKVQLPSLQSLTMIHVDNLRKIWCGELIMESFCTLQKLIIGHCNKLLNVFPSNMRGRLQTLDVLLVFGCQSVEEIFYVPEIRSCMMEENTIAKEELLEAVPRFTFPQLTCLRLSRLPKLKSFYSGKHVSEWPVLKKLDVWGCNKVEILASVFLSEIQQICEASQHDVSVQQPLFLTDKAGFPSLEVLDLFYMPKLLHLWKESSEFHDVFPSLITMEVSHCNNIKRLVPSSVSFPKLTALKVSNCSGLKNLVSLSTAKSLVNLIIMSVSNCEVMEALVINRGVGERDQISFSQFTCLELHCLPHLMGFYLGDCTFMFPSLQQVTVRQCPNMNTFSQGVISTPKLQRVKSIEGRDKWRWESDLNTTIQLLFKEMVGFHNIENLKLSKFPHLKEIWHDQLPVSFFSKLTSLSVDKCVYFLSAIPVNLLSALNNLTYLAVKDCDSLEEVFDLDDLNVHGHSGLSQLNAFRLIRLPRLQNIWSKTHLEILGFTNIREIYVRKCSSLPYIFTTSIILGLVQLEEVTITDCAMVEEIVIEDREMDAAMSNFIVPHLNFVFLESLPVLTSFYSRSNVLECPCLSSITITNCPKMKTFVFSCTEDLDLHNEPLFSKKVAFPILKELKLSKLPELFLLWNESGKAFQNLATLQISECGSLKTLFPSSMSFQNLTTLEISKCDSLTNLVTLPTAIRLEQLTRINVADCKMMQEIIMHVGDEDHAQAVLQQLKFLGLHCLPNIAGFYLGTYTIEFPTLEHVIVRQCPRMITFCRASVSTPKLQRVQIEESDDAWHWEGDLNTTIQQLSEEMVKIRDLEILQLSKFPKLKEIWHGQIHTSFFSNLKALLVDECVNISSAVPVSLLPCLNNLELLGVKNCDSLEEVFHLEGINVDGHPRFLSQLNGFAMSGLPRLRNIWNKSHLKVLGFINLRKLHIHKCNSLGYIFTTTVILGLVQLRELTIKDCVVLEEIIREDREKDAVMDNIVVPMLSSIVMDSLPTLTSFYSGNSVLECPDLVTITITNCPRMKTFVWTSMEDTELCNAPLFGKKVAFPRLEELKLSNMPELVQLSNEASNAFQNLATLQMAECDSLRSLFPPSMSLQKLLTLEVSKCDVLVNLVTFPTAKSLQQLTKIKVDDCQMMEEIITHMGDEQIDGVIFRQLKYIGLHCLPSITGFYFGDYTIAFPALEQVVVKQCPKMNTFAQGIVSTPKLQRVHRS